MTLFAYLNGSDQAHKVRLGRLGLTSKADGSAGFGNIVFDDPEGTLEIRGWMHVVVKETACVTAPCIYAGYVADRRYARGSADGTYMTGAARFIDITLVDLNTLLHFQAMFAAEANRPAESEEARIDWLLGSQYVQGIVAGIVNSSSGRDLDKDDFRGQYPDDVLSSLVNTWIYFVYLTQPDGDPALFYDTPTATTGTSTLSISNDLDDITFDETGVTSDCFPSSIEAEMEMDPSEVYARIGLEWVGGPREIQSDVDTYNTFFAPSGLGYRSLAYSSDRVKSAATAASYVARMLERDSTENETITDTITVPATKVGLITAGNRLQTKYLHFGDTDFVYRRTTGIEIHQHPGRNDWYDITLELNSKGSGGIGGGGGDPGDFPHQPAPAPSYKESAFATTTSAVDHLTATFAATTALTDNIVALAESDVTTEFTWPAGFTELDAGIVSSGGSYSLAVASGLTIPSVRVDAVSGAVDRFVLGVIVVAGGTFETYTLRDEPGSPGDSTPEFPDITPGTGNAAVIVALAALQEAYGLLTSPTGYTIQIDTDSNNGINSRRINGWTNTIASTSGTYGGSPSYADVVAGTLAQVVISSGASANPPSPAQNFGPINPIETPDGATYTFTLPDGYEWADGSLTVFVNRLDQTLAVTSYDGAARTFTLAFAPWVGDIIEAYGQGR